MTAPRQTKKQRMKLIFMLLIFTGATSTSQAEPNIKDLRMLCKYYNVSADYLLGLPRNMPYPKK